MFLKPLLVIIKVLLRQAFVATYLPKFNGKASNSSSRITLGLDEKNRCIKIGNLISRVGR